MRLTGIIHATNSNCVPPRCDDVFLSLLGYLSAHAPYAPMPDAYGYGVSVSGSVHSPTASLEFNIAREDVYNPDNRSTTSFLVVGGDISIGLEPEGFSKTFHNGGNLSMSPYFARIYNVENVPVDYAGGVRYSTNTVAAKYGVTWGESYVPNDVRRRRAYSKIMGITTGFAASHNEGAAYYIPIKTQAPFQLPKYYNPIPHIRDMLAYFLGGG